MFKWMGWGAKLCYTHGIPIPARLSYRYPHRVLLKITFFCTSSVWTGYVSRKSFPVLDTHSYIGKFPVYRWVSITGKYLRSADSSGGVARFLHPNDRVCKTASKEREGHGTQSLRLSSHASAKEHHCIKSCTNTLLSVIFSKAVYTAGGRFQEENHPSVEYSVNQYERKALHISLLYTLRFFPTGLD